MSPQRLKQDPAIKGKNSQIKKQKQKHAAEASSSSSSSFSSSIPLHLHLASSSPKKGGGKGGSNSFLNALHDQDHGHDDQQQHQHQHQQQHQQQDAPFPPPPRRDKQQKQQKNKKKRSHDQSNGGGQGGEAATAGGSAASTSGALSSSLTRGADTEGLEEDDDDESDIDLNRARKNARSSDDDEVEADDEHDNNKSPAKKKAKKQHHQQKNHHHHHHMGQLPNGAKGNHNDNESGKEDRLLDSQKAAKLKANRLVLRLPKRSKGFGPSVTAPLTTTSSSSTTTTTNANPITAPRTTPLHPSTLSQTITTAQQSSSELSDVDVPEENGAATASNDKQSKEKRPSQQEDKQQQESPEAQAQADREALAAAIELAYESESSDGYSDLLDDDEDDLLEAEEAYLIADKLNRQGRFSRRGTHSPGTKRSSDGVQSDSEGLELSHSEHHYPLDTDAALFEMAQFDNGESTSDVEEDREVPVTWSGAEDDDILNDLDEFLGITKDDSAALRGLNTGTETEEVDDGQTMRFEDFLAEDDGSDSGSSDSSTEEEESSSEDDEEEQSVAATGTDVAERDDDEHIETTRDLVKKGGFVFFKTAAYDDDETESEEEPIGVEDEGGDTTDTLDDTDHIGMMRFGIEAADEDDEDAEEALANAIRDRNLIDAHNMGLSVSIEALAEQPEAVVLKTARSLGISTEMAAKILTSVGMSILVNSNGNSQSESRQSSTGSKELPGVAAAAGPVATSTAAGPSQPSTAVDASPVPGPSKVSKQPVRKTFEPVLGDFAPSGEADLCVVVGANEGPAPSPFSARKKRTRSSLRNMHAYPSPNGRGQSVASSISTQSMGSGRLAHSHSSEEPQYSFILELDDLVDSRMLPGTMSSVSEEDEDIDDGASISTAMDIPTSVTGVGDVSRWNRIPIGAFRSQNPDAYASLANAVFNGARDPIAAHDLSFHSEFAAPNNGSNKGRGGRRYIPVSPVLFPVGQSIKTITAVKARRERGKDKKNREGRSGRHKVKSEDGSRAGTPRSRPSSSHRSKHLGQNFLRLPQTQNSLPSDGLTHQISPLFSGVASGMSIPPLSL